MKADGVSHPEIALPYILDMQPRCSEGEEGYIHAPKIKR